MKDNGIIRISSTGANRDSAINKLEYVKYISPIVLKAFAEYMLKHSILPDGTKRAGDNWKKGFGETYRETKDIVFNSDFRHFMDLWLEHDGFESQNGVDEALGGIIFNTMAYWDAILKERLENKEVS